MNDIVTARAAFLKRVEDHVTGESARFAPVLDELIGWSEGRGLVFTSHGGVHDLLKFSKGQLAFWTLTPRPKDGAKLTVLGANGFPEALRKMARDEFAAIDGTVAKEDAVPVIAFVKLIWAPYRVRVLDLMGRLLDGL